MKYEKLSDETKINVMSYLDYETIASLGNTNKNNYVLYKKIKDQQYIPLYSTEKYYINKRSKYTNSIFCTTLFVKIISYDDKYISYKHIKYGNYDGYKYPISSCLLYFLSHDIINPSHGYKITTNKSIFDNEYEIYEEYKIYNKNKIFKNKIFFGKFMIQSLAIYLFFYLPVCLIVYLIYFFYYLFFILLLFVYIFHIVLMCEILFSVIFSTNIHTHTFI